MSWRVIQGDCRDLLRGVTVVHADPHHHIEYLDLPDNSIDAIVTDPPYGISFMSRNWDHDVPGPDYWREVLRVAKPGCHLVAFGGARTSHRLTCAIEEAGWDIRDCLMWIFGSGMPKSHNVAAGIDKSYGYPNRGKAIPTASSYQASDIDRKNKLSSNPVGEYLPKCADSIEHDGKGTGLKPAYEPIILARKPLIGTVAANILKHGTGALNIDDCRIGSESITINRFNDGAKPFGGGAGHPYTSIKSKGLWPANLILDPESATLLDEQTGILKSGAMRSGTKRKPNSSPALGAHSGNTTHADIIASAGGASRFFYTSKASKNEREGGLDGLDPEIVDDGRNKPGDSPYLRGKTKRRNTHPTVKPLSLARWLVRLVTPPGGVVADFFCGSGTMVAAARIEGFSAIGIDIEAKACEIARKRVAWAGVDAGNATEEDADRVSMPTQLGLFGRGKKT